MSGVTDNERTVERTDPFAAYPDLVRDIETHGRGTLVDDVLGAIDKACRNFGWPDYNVPLPFPREDTWPGLALEAVGMLYRQREAKPAGERTAEGFPPGFEWSDEEQRPVYKGERTAGTASRPRETLRVDELVEIVRKSVFHDKDDPAYQAADDLADRIDAIRLDAYDNGYRDGAGGA